MDIARPINREEYFNSVDGQWDLLMDLRNKMIQVQSFCNFIKRLLNTPEHDEFKETLINFYFAYESLIEHAMTLKNT